MVSSRISMAQVSFACIAGQRSSFTLCLAVCCAVAGRTRNKCSGSLLIDRPTFASKQQVNASIAVAPASGRSPGCVVRGRPVGAARFVVAGRRIKLDQAPRRSSQPGIGAEDTSQKAIQFVDSEYAWSAAASVLDRRWRAGTGESHCSRSVTARR